MKITVKALLPVCLMALCILSCSFAANNTTMDAGFTGPVVVKTEPQQAEKDVFRDAVIRITLSDHLDAHKVKPTLLKLYSGPLSLWLMTYYNPVKNELIAWPVSTMRKNVDWVFEFKLGLLGINGDKVAPVEVVRFTTGEETGDNHPYENITYESHVKKIFDQRCVSCHGGSNGILANVDLSNPQGIYDTVINEHSYGWPRWNRIVSNHPGQSYLLYKIIGDNRIDGQSMPRSPLLNDNSETLTTPMPKDEQQIISDWIAGGTFF